MIRTGTRQTLYIWIAMLAILFSALAPTISHALAANATSPVTLELCTANGYKAVKIPGFDSGEVPSSAKHGMEHCAFCATHGGSFAVPVSAPFTFAVNPVRNIYPQLFYAAPYPLNAWSSASPRAPPFLA